MNAIELRAYGIDSKVGISRCLNDENLYYRILRMFLKDKAFSQAQAAYAEGNYKELFNALHTLKGTSGNVALVDLYDAVCALVEYLRKGNTDNSVIDPMFTEIQKQYDNVIEGIKQL